MNDEVARAAAQWDSRIERVKHRATRCLAAAMAFNVAVSAFNVLQRALSSAWIIPPFLIVLAGWVVWASCGTVFLRQVGCIRRLHDERNRHLRAVDARQHDLRRLRVPGPARGQCPVRGLADLTECAQADALLEDAGTVLARVVPNGPWRAHAECGAPTPQCQTAAVTRIIDIRPFRLRHRPPRITEQLGRPPTHG